MMRRAVPAIMAMLLATAAVGAQQQTLSISVNVHALVFDREAASTELTDWAESIGGYFTLKSEERVVMRVPVAAVNDLRVLIYDRADLVVEYNPQAHDVRQELSELRAGIESREEALTRIMGYIEDADTASTLALERELTALLSELESLQGRLRARINDTRYAHVNIDLSTREASIPKQIPSSFSWINRIDLYQFLREVRR